MIDSRSVIVSNLRMLDSQTQLSETDSMSSISADDAVLEEVDIIRVEDVGVEDANSIMIITHYF